MIGGTRRNAIVVTAAMNHDRWWVATTIHRKGVEMLREVRTAMRMLAILTVLTGIVYPAAVTIVGQTLFPYQAGGSLIREQDKIVGSEWIGQPFTRPEYFWGRLSATSPGPYNGAASAGSNWGPTHPDLLKSVEARMKELRNYGDEAGPVPVELVTASGSGLDPHLSLAAVEYQIPRVAQVRRLSIEVIHDLVHQHTLGRQWGMLGEPRVHVLHLNRALDALGSSVATP